MPMINLVALGIKDKLMIYGGDYNTNDGTAERDYIHVVDLIYGHLKALDYLQNFNGHDSINLGRVFANSSSMKSSAYWRGSFMTSFMSACGTSTSSSLRRRSLRK